MENIDKPNNNNKKTTINFLTKASLIATIGAFAQQGIEMKEEGVYLLPYLDGIICLILFEVFISQSKR